MLQYSYRAYGLNILSEIECPELLPINDPWLKVDVHIRVLPVSKTSFDDPEVGKYLVEPNRFQLKIADVARYCVEDGSQITIEPFADALPGSVRLFLLGSTFGALLYQRGMIPIHGCTVATAWGAMLFVGDQGAGKSTLAESFRRAGYRLLSDDVSAVTSEDGRLIVHPALTHVRLCRDAWQRSGAPKEAEFNIDKFVVPMGDSYCRESQPLRAVHLLSFHNGNNPTITPLHGLDRVQCVLRNLYRPVFLMGQSTQKQHLQMATEIARNADLFAVVRKRSIEKINDIVDLLATSWAERYDHNLQESAS